MFGLLRKKRTALVEPAMIPASLQMVPVRRTSFDMLDGTGIDLVSEITFFVEKMRQEIADGAGEIPPLALQSFHATQYVAQVCKSGHKHFLKQCRDNSAEVFMEAQTGLKAMGAMDHLDVLEDMLAIVNLDRSASILDEISEELSVLDDEMIDLEATGALANKAAKWIQNWLILQVLDDAEYASTAARGFCVTPLHDILTDYPVESISPELTDAQKEFAMMRNADLEGEGLSNRHLPQ